MRHREYMPNLLYMRTKVRLGVADGAIDVTSSVIGKVSRLARRRCDLQMRELPSAISDFVERHEDRDRRQLTLRLV